jgi:Cd2+/Zn2+-exporting ATPase
MNTSTFKIEQMCCPAEERLIRNGLADVAEISNLEFNLIARTLTVTHSLPDGASLRRKIATLGMDAVPLDPVGSAVGATAPTVPWWKRPEILTTFVSGICAVVAEALAWTWLSEESLVVGLLAAVAIVAGGYGMAGRAWASLKTLTLNIHFLMTVAVLGAVVLGDWTEAGMVVFLFALAELVEARSMEHARSAIGSLMKLAPDSATVMRGLGWEQVPVAEVEPGEVVRIRPGDRLPLDGVVRHGVSSVNQAPITGESLPVDKEVGDPVFAGSINQTGTLDYVVTRPASDSTVSRIVRLVEKATANRGKAERFIDRFARRYTPAIVAVAVLVAVLPPLLFAASWSVWVYRGLVLLVIGCPCALVISTPVTIVSGLAAAARRGILIKGGSYLELGAELKGIAFDKTGTLTEGQPSVTDIIPLDGLGAPEIVCLAAGVESRSEHPIASAIVREHRSHHDHEDVAAVDFRTLPGRGARAVIDGRTVLVGNHRMAHEVGVCNQAIEVQLDRLESEGKTAVMVMTEASALGVIGVSDTIRESSVTAVERLHSLGLRTALLTGDNRTAAGSIARRVGIDDVYSELLPEDKIDAFERIRERTGAMGMVGDGINDVPVLAHAQIGFVMGGAGTDIALETADVALMEDNLLKVSEFIALSRRAMRVLRQNVSVAIIIKLVFFALAVFGEATLWMAVFADMGASLIVVFNGLRLLKGEGDVAAVPAA